MVEGACFCGAVRYEVAGPFRDMTSCHCSMCRKHHGSAFATYVSAPLGGFRWLAGAEALLRYQSSPQGQRTSCRRCGSPLPELLPEGALVQLPAGPLEGELGLRPQSHIFVGSKASWYTITDELPQYEEYPPGMSSPVVERARKPSHADVAEGSCLCGAIAYEARGPALFMQNCHCQRCRRARGAAHASNIFYRMDQFQWMRGQELLREYKLPEARFYTTSFCSQCGAGLPRVSRERELVVIPAGGLDTDPPLSPQRHIFTHYKAPWFEITDATPQFAEAPPAAPGPTAR
jgi:hypothetical protein